MMRSWAKSYQRAIPVAIVTAAVISVVTHATVIVGWVLATLPSQSLPRESLANHVFFIPPPDRAPVKPGDGTGETVHYVKLADTGPGAGGDVGPKLMGDARPAPPADTKGDKGVDSVASQPAAPPVQQDSVFSILEVDTAVVRSANSAAPAYPLKLLQDHVQGYVQARYVVDTTGFADTSSFEVVKSTNSGFVAAVRDALPYMRFSPAKIGPLKVRQLVEQQFSFKITDTAKARPIVKRP